MRKPRRGASTGRGLLCFEVQEPSRSPSAFTILRTCWRVYPVASAMSFCVMPSRAACRIASATSTRRISALVSASRNRLAMCASDCLSTVTSVPFTFMELDVTQLRIKVPGRATLTMEHHVPYAECVSRTRHKEAHMNLIARLARAAARVIRDVAEAPAVARQLRTLRAQAETPRPTLERVPAPLTAEDIADELPDVADIEEAARIYEQARQDANAAARADRKSVV